FNLKSAMAKPPGQLPVFPFLALGGGTIYTRLDGTSPWSRGSSDQESGMFTRRNNATRALGAVLAGLVLAAVPAAATPPPGAKAVEHFERRVRPLLVARCQKCHGPEKQRGGLRLDSASGATRGGDSGRVIVPGKPDASPLIQAVRQIGDRK